MFTQVFTLPETMRMVSLCTAMNNIRTSTSMDMCEGVWHLPLNYMSARLFMESAQASLLTSWAMSWAMWIDPDRPLTAVVYKRSSSREWYLHYTRKHPTPSTQPPFDVSNTHAAGNFVEAMRILSDEPSWCDPEHYNWDLSTQPVWWSKLVAKVYAYTKTHRVPDTVASQILSMWFPIWLSQNACLTVRTLSDAESVLHDLNSLPTPGSSMADTPVYRRVLRYISSVVTWLPLCVIESARRQPVAYQLPRRLSAALFELACHPNGIPVNVMMVWTSFVVTIRPPFPSHRHTCSDADLLHPEFLRIRDCQGRHLQPQQFFSYFHRTQKHGYMYQRIAHEIFKDHKRIAPQDMRYHQTMYRVFNWHRCVMETWEKHLRVRVYPVPENTSLAEMAVMRVDDSLFGLEHGLLARVNTGDSKLMDQMLFEVMDNHAFSVTDLQNVEDIDSFNAPDYVREKERARLEQRRSQDREPSSAHTEPNSVPLSALTQVGAWMNDIQAVVPTE